MFKDAGKTLLLVASVLLIGFAVSRFMNSPEVPSGETGENNTAARLSELLGAEDAGAYPQATQARFFHFPDDHGPHLNFRNEWWYLTGNLDDETGQRFGFELTFFRFSLAPGRPTTGANSASVSDWRTRQVYIAHFAVTDKKNEQFHVAQRASRDALGLAGARAAPFRVWLEDWSVGVAADGHWVLTASTDSMSLTLDLIEIKPPVLNGIDGLSQKSAQAGIASYYYSIPRLRSKGVLQIAGESHAVTGLSWLDREWGSSALATDQQGWDWFALQLSDGSDLMFYNIRKNDGSQDPHSAGTWIHQDGRSRHMSRDDVRITVTGEWQSPAGGAYPSGWNVSVPALELELTVTPLIANQELFTTVRYWEGAVDVAGTRHQQVIGGRGYVELTGYAR